MVAETAKASSVLRGKLVCFIKISVDYFDQIQRLSAITSFDPVLRKCIEIIGIGRTSVALLQLQGQFVVYWHKII